MLHCGNVENCEDTSASMVARGEIKRKGRTYCVARAPNDVSYKINTHIPDITPLSKGCSRMTTMDAKSSKSRRFYYSMSLASCSVPVLQRILDLLPPPSKSASEYGPPPPSKSASEYGHHPPPPHQTFLLSSVCIIFGNYNILGGGWNPRRIIFPPPTSGSRDLRNCFASQISHVKHHLFPGSSEKIPVSDGNDRQLPLLSTL